MKHSGIFFSVAVLLFSIHAKAPASTIDLPDSGEQAGITGFVFRSNVGTLQWVISSSLLTELPIGSQISGIAFRLNGGTTAMESTITNISYLNWNLSISQSRSSPGALSTTFANNIGADNTLVRSGPLTIVANSYPVAAGSPEPWGPVINFQTPYTYAGGDLLFSLTQNTSHEISGLQLLDATSESPNSSYQAQFANAFNATIAATIAGTPAFQLIIPEPKPLALVVLGVLLLFSRRSYWPS